MPTYVYVCPNDGTEHESKQSLDEYAKESEKGGHYVCPECGNNMRRKFSPPAVQIN